MWLLVLFAELKQFSKTCHVPFWRKILLGQLNYPIKVKPLHLLPRSDNLKVMFQDFAVDRTVFFASSSFICHWLTRPGSIWISQANGTTMTDIIRYYLYHIFPGLSYVIHMLFHSSSIWKATALHQIRHLHPARSLRTSSDTTPLQCPSAVEISPDTPGKVCWCPVSEVIQKWSYL